MIVYQDVDPLAGEVANDIQEPGVDTVIWDIVVADTTDPIGVWRCHLHEGQSTLFNVWHMKRQTKARQGRRRGKGNH